MRYQAVTEVSPIIVGIFHRQSWQGKQDYPAIGLRSVPAPLQSARSASACAARARRARRHRPCRLVLMDLARAWPGTERVRAALKRLDRLLGSAFLQGACRALYGAMARWLIRQPRPIIIVDRSEVLQPNGRWHLLRAGIAIGGTHGDALRSRTPERLKNSPRAESQLLVQLHTPLPAGVIPSLVCDAGFRAPRFRAVRRLGWDYVGRV